MLQRRAQKRIVTIVQIDADMTVPCIPLEVNVPFLLNAELNAAFKRFQHGNKVLVPTVPLHRSFQVETKDNDASVRK